MTSYPVVAMAKVLPHAAPDAAFKLAFAWWQGQPWCRSIAEAVEHDRACLGLLLNTVSWGKAMREQLRAEVPGADDVPGLHRRLYEAMDALLRRRGGHDVAADLAGVCEVPARCGCHQLM